MPDQRGLTLVELLIAVALCSLMMTAALILSVPLIARETLRGAVHDTGSFLQMAKMEAVSRNRNCRFGLDTTDGTLAVWDMNGTSTATDDLLLHRGRLPTTVGFARPDSGSVISLGSLGGGVFAVVFTPTGVASHGTGEIFYQGGGSYGRVSVHSAGGVSLRRWDGAVWKEGA